MRSKSSNRVLYTICKPELAKYMKRLFILGFVFVLLLAIPLTLFLLGEQTKTRSGASPATRLSFVPASKDVNVGDAFSLDVSLNPGTSGTPNVISFINLNIQYSSNLALDTTKGDNNSGITIHPVNGKALVILTPLSAPQCGAATCLVTLSLGVNPGDQGIQTVIPALITLYMVAQSASDPNNQSTIDLSSSKIYSTGQNDQPSNNVLTGADPATINVTAPSTTPSPSVTDSPTPAGGETPTDTPVPGGGGNPTDTPTTVPGSTTGTPQASGTPTCTSLAVDNLNGNAPLTVNFTTTGNDADGSVSKITYNFGDGQVQDITSGSGIGTTVVNSQVAHTYNSDGTYTASSAITDGGGAVSDPGACTQTITVGSGGGTSTPSATMIAKAPTATPTIPSSGPGETIVNVGILGGVLSVLGAILIFAL